MQVGPGAEEPPLQTLQPGSLLLHCSAGSQGCQRGTVALAEHWQVHLRWVLPLPMPQLPCPLQLLLLLLPLLLLEIAPIRPWAAATWRKIAQDSRNRCAAGVPMQMWAELM